MTYLWRGIPVKRLRKTLLGMMAKCGTCPTLVWCILRRISYEWFWMLQQGSQALHWMTCFLLDLIWQTHWWEYCIDFVKTELPSYLILNVSFTRQGPCVTTWLPAPLVVAWWRHLQGGDWMSHAHAYFWGRQFTSCRHLCPTQNSCWQRWLFQLWGSGDGETIVLRRWLFEVVAYSRGSCSSCNWIREFTQQGGFHLAKWVSNSRELLSSIPDKDRSKNVQSFDLDYDDIPSEKALGVLWTVEADWVSMWRT